MTYLTRFQPFGDFNSLQSQVNRLFQDFTRGSGSDELLTSGTFVPAVDIYEDDHFITLKLEVPGIAEKDLDIQLENNTLTIRGERKLENEEKQENFHRIERSYGSFARAFTLPNTVNAESVHAIYENGILKIELGKREEAKPKQIKVNVTSGAAAKSIDAGRKGQAA